MKKVIKLIIMTILIIFIILGIKFIILNKAKPSLTAEEFKQTMEEKDFTILNITSKYSDYDYVKEVYAAVDNNSTYEIDFYLLSDISHGKEFYNIMKDNLKSSKNKGDRKKGSDYSYYGKYILYSKDQYRQISRVNDTIISIDVRTKYKDELLNLLNDLGY